MALLEKLIAQPPPLRLSEGGVLRVGKTRVRLDTVIEAFRNGSTPEEIVYKYPSLNLTDVYAVITYYLWHRDEVNQYLNEQRRLNEEAKAENEKRFPSAGIRERLLARRAAKLEPTDALPDR
jgi:uncharacterized protein (DUF433 family)